MDNDCLGGDDYDKDGDGETSSSYNGTDCDDTNPAINTSAEEIYYDGVDQDCDNNEMNDQDGDGFDGTPSETLTASAQMSQTVMTQTRPSTPTMRLKSCRPN